MTVELALIVSGISVIFSIISSVTAIARNNRIDTASDTTQITTVIVKLESIGKALDGITKDLRDFRQTVQLHTAKLAVMESQIETLNNAVFKKGNENK